MGIKASQAAAAIRKNDGFVSYAAKDLGITREHLYVLIRRHPTVKAALNDARESMKDLAEKKLRENIESKKEASIFFYLKTQAKDRGYGEKEKDERRDDSARQITHIVENRSND